MELAEADPMWGWMAPEVDEAAALHVGTHAMPDGSEIRGWYLARWSSEREDHTHISPRPGKGESCQACRWFELSLWKLEAGGYVMVRHNVSNISGESDRLSVHRVDEARHLLNIQGLGIRSRPLRVLLTDAAQWDDAMRGLVHTVRWETPTY